MTIENVLHTRNLAGKSGWDLGGREECEKFPDYHNPCPLPPSPPLGRMGAGSADLNILSGGWHLI